MRGYLIDPFEKKIEVVEVSGGKSHLSEIYAAIGRDCFDVIRVGSVDVGYVDDEGLFRADQRYFTLPSYSQPLAGKCLVLGVDFEGSSASVEMSLSELKGQVQWVRPDLRFVREDETSGEIDHPVFGKMHSIVRTPIFADRDGNEFRADELRD